MKMLHERPGKSECSIDTLQLTGRITYPRRIIGNSSEPRERGRNPLIASIFALHRGITGSTGKGIGPEKFLRAGPEGVVNGFGKGWTDGK